MRKYLIDLGFILACLCLAAATITAASAFWAAAALADDGAGTAIDFSPLVNEALSALASAALALSVWGIHRAAVWLGLKQDSEVRAYLERAAEAGIAMVRVKAGDALSGRLTVDAKIALAQEVGQYLVDRVPDAVTRFGLHGDALTDYVLGRLGEPLALSTGPETTP